MVHLFRAGACPSLPAAYVESGRTGRTGPHCQSKPAGGPYANSGRRAETRDALGRSSPSLAGARRARPDTVLKPPRINH
jgi:hypothetical protein